MANVHQFEVIVVGGGRGADGWVVCLARCEDGGH